ncbi:hypothetical protein RN001_011921 [Aquatica leii]|uniref:Major facilitator superfamily (MFS) profile domain-containing protein n=1 Tax=Aquatica leii TaxID=1421715 RepID=A0AAN7P2A1_9COLE|nr:hypothetical protein RN001_011921 [Aquatica leii]
MHAGVKCLIPDNRIGSNNNYDEICNNFTETELLQNENEAENQVAKFKQSRGLLAQSLLTAIVTILTASAGMPIGYSAILLPQLKSVNGSLQIDDEMGSWIASIHSAATPVGSLLSGVFMDYFGRKATLQLSCLPLIAGWVFITSSHNHTLILVGRVLAGTAVGLIAAPCQVYVAEVSDPKMRGMLSGIPFASYAFGILLVYMLGTAAHWRIVAGLSVILPTLAILVFFFLPESPVWLVRKGQVEKASKACYWLRGGNLPQMKQEIEQLIKRAKEEKLHREQHPQSTWRTFCTPQVLKPFMIVNIFGLFQSLCGVYLIVFYAVEIISTMGNEMNEFLAAVLTAGVRFVFTIVASILLAFVGRRTISLISAIGTSLTAFCLALLLYSECYSKTYFVTVILLLYVATNTIGFLVLPGVLVGELFPTKIRGLAGSLTFTNFNLTIFGVTKIFPYMKALLDIHGFFLLFGVFSFIASIFLYLTLPETKNKSLNEIEDYFLQENILWITRKQSSNNSICIKKSSKV